MGRTVFIGDVHGCSRELQDLLDRIRWTPDDRVVFVGDLVGRGPDSRGVLEQARRIQAVSVVGNHELRFLRVRAARALGERGAPLSPGHYADLDAFTEEDWACMRAMPKALEFPEHGVLVVHAGIVPGLPIDQHSLDDLTRMRAIDAEGKATSRYSPTPWAASYRKAPHVVFGHNARAGLQLYSHATGLDTGCVYGNALTALLLAENQQVPATPEDRRKCLRFTPAREMYADPTKA